ncbi:hypothetical protein ACR3IL_00550 [Streptococcus iniae]
MPIEDLRRQWDGFTAEERQEWYTTKCIRLKVDANDVIDYVIDKMADDGYEDMGTMLIEQLPKDATAKLQAVLDELFDNDAADVYFPDELIEVEE